jgi:hypothetical protein
LGLLELGFEETLALGAHATTLVAVFGAVGGVGFPLTVIVTKFANELIFSGMNHPVMGADGVLPDTNFLTELHYEQMY